VEICINEFGTLRGEDYITGRHNAGSKKKPTNFHEFTEEAGRGAAVVYLVIPFFFFSFFLHRLRPLKIFNDDEKLLGVEWSPTGNGLAYVYRTQIVSVLMTQTY
jgi:hypothetical protein